MEQLFGQIFTEYGALGLIIVMQSVAIGVLWKRLVAVTDKYVQQALDQTDLLKTMSERLDRMK